MTATVTALRKEKPVSVGALIEKMWKNREERRSLEAQVKVLNTEYEPLEQQLIALMDKEGVNKSTGKLASAGISENTRPTIKDDTAFYAYIHKNKYYHLLERRPSVSGCNEILALKGLVPGIEFFTKRTINLTTVK
jgi:hypothetical protein